MKNSMIYCCGAYVALCVVLQQPDISSLMAFQCFLVGESIYGFYFIPSAKWFPSFALG